MAPSDLSSHGQRSGPSPSPTATPSSLAWGRYAELRPLEIEAIRQRAPIAYIPWGALEWHCHHAPIGLDSTKAEGICLRLAEVTGGIVLPPLPLGVNTIKPFKGFSHTIDISADLAARVADELCRQLADEGFELIVLFTGHYPPEQIDALEAGAERARKAHPRQRFVVWADNMFLGETFPADHAGATETSFQMCLAPDSVDLGALPGRPLTLDGDGVTGEDPRMASRERGERQLALVVKNAAAEIRSMLAEGKGQK